MSTQGNHKSPTLVLVTHVNRYRRFVGRTQTHHVISDRLLTPAEVEDFRTNPEGMMPPEPEVA
jgi:hypothetical protein